MPLYLALEDEYRAGLAERVEARPWSGSSLEAGLRFPTGCRRRLAVRRRDRRAGGTSCRMFVPAPGDVHGDLVNNT